MTVPRPSRRSAVAPFYVMEFAREAAAREAAGHDVVHLEVGQPSTGAPPGAIAAVERALASGRPLGYTDANGLARLRSGIASLYLERYGVEVEPSSITVTTGASAACVLAFLAAFDTGDRVAVCEPGYPCYRQMLESLGVDVVAVRVDESTRYQPTVERLAAALPLNGVVIASPSNPTGSMLTHAELNELTGWCEANGIRLIADEIYHGITFDRPAPTAAAALVTAPHGGGPVVIGSFSKYFSMTGWRVGWMVCDEQLSAPVERLAQNLMICPPAVSQLAAIGALTDSGHLDGHVERYRSNRDALLRGLATVGIDTTAPADGAFYVWADVSHLTDDSFTLCRRWLSELDVAVTPGLDFDPGRGQSHVRFSLAGTPDDIERAVRRLAGWSGV